MRTTLSLDPDIVERARELAARNGESFRDVVNRLLRAGLEQSDRRPQSLAPYRTQPHHRGLVPGVSLDNVQELLSRVEGEDAR